MERFEITPPIRNYPLLRYGTGTGTVYLRYMSDGLIQQICRSILKSVIKALSFQGMRFLIGPCCGSVMFIPNPDLFHSRISVPGSRFLHLILARYPVPSCTDLTLVAQAFSVPGKICYPIGSSTLNSVELNSVFLLFPIHPLLGKMF